jgi:uncharacterized protein YkwD
VALTAAVALVVSDAARSATTSPRARNVVAEVNAVRRTHGLVPLRVSAGLTTAAREHSTEMARAGYFAHESLAGTTVFDRIAHYYSFAGRRYWSVGENIAWASPDLGALRVLRMWLRSVEHRDTLLTRQWREIGIGVSHVSVGLGVFDGLSVTIITADFGVRR